MQTISLHYNLWDNTNDFTVCCYHIGSRTKIFCFDCNKKLRASVKNMGEILPIATATAYQRQKKMQIRFVLFYFCIIAKGSGRSDCDTRLKDAQEQRCGNRPVVLRDKSLSNQIKLSNNLYFVIATACVLRCLILTALSQKLEKRQLVSFVSIMTLKNNLHCAMVLRRHKWRNY